MDAIVIESAGLKIWEDWKLGKPPIAELSETVRIPDSVIPGVSKDIYDAYRRGRDSACVDIVLVTRNERGKLAVILSKRAQNVCYAGTWFIYGGALGAYQSILRFTADRAEKECGIRIAPQVLIGVYRTCSSDIIGSTMQACFAAFVPPQAAQKMRIDDAHQSVRLFTLEDLAKIPEPERHWYPLRVAERAIKNCPF